MVNQSIVSSVQNYLRMVNNSGLRVAFGVIFGSQVSGNSDPWSDIDLLVISPRFDAPYTRTEVNLLWHLAANTDSRIEPIPCGERQWQEDDASAIIEIARRQGEKVEIEEQANAYASVNNC